MSFDGFLKAIEEYRRDPKDKVQHAGNLSYADDRGDVVARSTAAGSDGELRAISSKEKAEAQRRKKLRKS